MAHGQEIVKLKNPPFRISEAFITPRMIGHLIVGPQPQSSLQTASYLAGLQPPERLWARSNPLTHSPIPDSQKLGGLQIFIFLSHEV